MRGLRSCLRRRCARTVPTTRDQTAAYESSAFLGSADGRQEVMSGVRFDDVTKGSNTEGVPGDLNRVMLAQENDPGLGRNNTDASRGLNPADPGQADVQEDDGRLQLPSLLHGLFSIRALSYDIEIGVTGQN